MSVSKTSSINQSSSTGGGYAVPSLRATINTTSNWTVPTGVKAITFVLAGGGGGGGATSNNNTSNGGGGGGGGGLNIRTVAVTPGSTVAVAVGTGGTGGVGSNSAYADGTAGGASSITVGNTIFYAYGSNGGGGQVGAAGNANSGAAGGTGPALYPDTNFVLELSPTVKTVLGSSYSYNSISRGGSQLKSTAATDYNCALVLGNMSPYTGNNTNFVVQANVNTLDYSGGGGPGDTYSTSANAGYNAAALTGGNLTFRGNEGGGGITGGGGGGGGTNAYGGAGGGGAGGVGGTPGFTLARGGGGGGGITGAGTTNNTTTGGAGGTGGGGGGGGAYASLGSGGAGGAGACLIYY